jgi:GTP-binding protein HflX
MARVRLELPYGRGDLLDLLYREAKVLSTEYREDVIETEAVITPRVMGRVREFIRKP